MDRFKLTAEPVSRLIGRYCQIIQGEDTYKQRKKKRNSVLNILRGDTIPRLDTFLAIVTALGGRLTITWDDDQENNLKQEGEDQ
jgi:hypothetical protein